jgi:hypothetical protein
MKSLKSVQILKQGCNNIGEFHLLLKDKRAQNPELSRRKHYRQCCPSLQLINLALRLNHYFTIFCVFLSFWCVDIKNNFFLKKNIILMHFQVKNTLKYNPYHTLKQTLKHQAVAFGILQSGSSSYVIISKGYTNLPVWIATKSFKDWTYFLLAFRSRR